MHAFITRPGGLSLLEESASLACRGKLGRLNVLVTRLVNVGRTWEGKTHDHVNGGTSASPPRHKRVASCAAVIIHAPRLRASRVAWTVRRVRPLDNMTRLPDLYLNMLAQCFWVPLVCRSWDCRSILGFDVTYNRIPQVCIHDT